MAEQPTTSGEKTESPHHERASLLSDSDSHSSKGSRSEHRQKSSLKLYTDQSAACSSGYDLSSGCAADCVEPTDGSLKKLSKVTIYLKNEESSFFEVSHDADERTSLLSDSTISSPGRKSSTAGGREIRLHYNPDTRTVEYSRSSSFESPVRLRKACAVPRSQSTGCFGQNVDDGIQVFEPLEASPGPVQDPPTSSRGNRVRFLLTDSSDDLSTLSGTPPPINNQQISFKRRSVEAWCSKCRKPIRTLTKTRPRNCILYCMVVLCTCGCALCFTGNFVETQHKCPECMNLIAVYPDARFSEREYVDF